MCLSRKEARLLNAKHYFTGKPCKNGHVSNRYTDSGSCFECRKARRSLHSKTYRENNLEKLKLRKAKYHKENSKKLCEKSSLWYANNKEKALKRSKEYKKKNYLLVRFWVSNRKKKVKLATPKWANLEKIKEVYLNCPKGMEIDHIIPLQGKLVCGLHVENNLQYLTPEENLKKLNKFEIHIDYDSF